MENKAPTKFRDTSAKKVDNGVEELEDVSRRLRKLEKEFKKREEELEEARGRDTPETLKKLEDDVEELQQGLGLSYMYSMNNEMAAFNHNWSVLRYLLGQAGKRLVTISGKDNWEAFAAEYLAVDSDLWIPGALVYTKTQTLFETTPGLSEHEFNEDEQFMICFPDDGWYGRDIGDSEYSKEEIWKAVTSFKPGDEERIKFEKIFRFTFPGCDTGTLPDTEGSMFARQWRKAVDHGLFKN
ncbi:hypothetical protein BJ165DRAFT_396151 [Panaeolus papilionaceus]|nr:hypothetical protein BJ165DRAFT_396151 [Panaeolus papilionaceus]